MIHTITVDAGKIEHVVIVKTTFRLYWNNPESLRILYELSNRIYRETKLNAELFLRGDKTFHLTSRKRLTKETLLRKVEMAVGIIKEVYDVPLARTQIQQGLF